MARDRAGRLAALLDLPLRELLRLARRRLPGGGRRAAWTVDEVLSHGSKHRRGERLVDALLRWDQAGRRKFGRDILAFEGAHVLEIGCGPLAGFGPLALFLGADRVEAADPEFDPALFEDPRIERSYLAPLHADLSAVHGERMTLAAFVDAVRTRLAVHRCALDAAPLGRAPDLVLSMSCLEHVFPLESVAAVLARHGGPHLRQFHLVDFGNHYPTPGPFDGLYVAPPETYLAGRPGQINLLRLRDVVAAFAASGMTLAPAFVRRFALPADAPPHRWWRERYGDDELSVRDALLIAPGESR